MLMLKIIVYYKRFYKTSVDILGLCILLIRVILFDYFLNMFSLETKVFFSIFFELKTNILFL